MLKRGYIGVYHKMSPKHTSVAESRAGTTAVGHAQMASVVRDAVVRYVDLMGRRGRL